MDRLEQIKGRLAASQSTPEDLQWAVEKIERLLAFADLIDLAVYDSFAYALGPDMWEQCSMEFKDAIDKAAEASA